MTGERIDDEVFVGNTACKHLPDHLCNIDGIRTGKVAYDIHGKVCAGLYPIIVKKGKPYNTYNYIMERRLKAVGESK